MMRDNFDDREPPSGPVPLMSIVVRPPTGPPQLMGGGHPPPPMGHQQPPPLMSIPAGNPPPLLPPVQQQQPPPLLSLQTERREPPPPPQQHAPSFQDTRRLAHHYEPEHPTELHPSLEDAIEFRMRLAKARGISDINEVVVLQPDSAAAELSSDEDEGDDEDEQAESRSGKKGVKAINQAARNKKRKQKKKQAKARKREEKTQREKENEAREAEEANLAPKKSFWSQPSYKVAADASVIDVPDDSDDLVDDVEIEYVDDKPELDASDPNSAYFAKVFEAFKIGEAEAAEDESAAAEEAEKEAAAAKEAAAKKATLAKETKSRIFEEEEDDDEEKEKKANEEDASKISKRKLKEMMRPSIAALKATCTRPDVVEWHDVTAKDPKLLVLLKATRNTVPVPRHWCFKRKYLAGKRGFEKTPFQLPDFIQKTGITEMREALAEKEDAKTMKAKMREKVRPKLGKIDIDYQKLHDAFFRWQTKPKMTAMGDLYYEGKEFETKMKDKKPGELSDDLRIALGMPLGPTAFKFPPPWLIAMQRYGPPPSYPNLKIAGLNAPIPEGCTFGYHPGGWGKPPVDEMGKPLYGDVFGVEFSAQKRLVEEEEIDRTPWGELESEESESESEEESSEEDEDKEMADQSGVETPATGLITPSGMSSSVTAGLETPDTVIELRKRKVAEEGGDTPALYTVLPEKRVDRIGGQMMASTHVYDVAAAAPTAGKKGEKEAAAGREGVEIALNPEELEMDTAAMTAKYEQTIKAQQDIGKEDFSDLIAEHAARQKKKRKAVEEKKTQQTKKLREFKF